MPRGKGVRLQRYKDGGLADAKAVQQEGRADLYRRGEAQLHFVRRPSCAIGGARAPRPAACRRKASPSRKVRPALLDREVSS